MPTRAEVYSAIDSERNYQDQFITGVKYEDAVHTVGEEILMMEDYLVLARNAFTHNPGDAEALEVLRKVVGMGVRCMEHHGAPHRVVDSGR